MPTDFEEDFGLEIRFDVYRNTHRKHQKCTILAHIVFPSQRATMLYSYDDHSIFSSMIIDHIPEPTLDQRELFQAALNTLRLQPMLHDLQKGQNALEELEPPALSPTFWPRMLVLTSGLL